MNDITNSIEKYVNDQNRTLWENLNEKYQIELYHDSKDYSWKTRNENGIVTIVCPNLEIDFASFTHELLHTYIESQGMTNFESYRDSYIYDNIFGNFVFNGLFSNCYNFFAHKKMYPYFEEMGFYDFEFISDVIKYPWSRHQKMKLFFKIRRLKIFGIEQFLGNFFALKNNFLKDNEYNCQKSLNKLKNFQPELYEIADKFDKNWQEQNDLNLLIPFNEFKSDLKYWLAKNYSRDQW